VFLNVLIIGAVGGVVSGMLGVGGAVILLPLLSTFGGLTLKQASSITIVQVVAASLISWLAYARGRMVHLQLALYMGAASAAGGLVGGIFSKSFSSHTLEWIFFVVVMAAIALLFIPARELVVDAGGFPPFNRWLALGLGGFVGTLAGILGAGGGFLVVPLMISLLRLPTRMAIGSSPVVILVSGSFGFAGKLLSGQIRPDLAAALVIGAAPCAYVGTQIGRRLRTRFLRALLAVILILIALRSAVLLFFPGVLGE
jgi:uncharacterized membrane protein YfcA